VNPKAAGVRRLIYPLPTDAGGLGVHLTLDLSGAARFGPDVEWLPPPPWPPGAAADGGGAAAAAPGAPPPPAPGDPSEGFDYRVDPARAAAFYASVRTYWPGLPDGGLAPAYSGVRPKLSGPGQPAADFRIAGPADSGVPGYAALYGIESPGLTSSLAIAARVVRLLQ